MARILLLLIWVHMITVRKGQDDMGGIEVNEQLGVVMEKKGYLLDSSKTIYQSIFLKNLTQHGTWIYVLLVVG